MKAPIAPVAADASTWFTILGWRAAHLPGDVASRTRCGQLIVGEQRPRDDTPECSLCQKLGARPAHGTSAAYRRGCRCEACATYQRQRVKRNRAERLARTDLKHGVRASYDAGCRCTDCHAARVQAYRRECGAA